MHNYSVYFLNNIKTINDIAEGALLRTTNVSYH